ncbi:MAG: hypothetical protein R3264_16375 [Anaerolineae bacterium]|nr:hypothetical protein [Anaerolineae bacterium]
MTQQRPLKLWRPRVIAISMVVLGIVANFAVSVAVGFTLATANWWQLGHKSKALLHVAAGVSLVFLFAAFEKPGFGPGFFVELLIIPFVIYYAFGLAITLYLFYQLRHDSQPWLDTDPTIQEPAWSQALIVTVVSVVGVGLLQFAILYATASLGLQRLAMSDLITTFGVSTEFRGIAAGLVQPGDFSTGWRWEYSSVARNEGLAASIWADEEQGRVLDRAAHSLAGAYGSEAYEVTFFHLIKQWREPISAEIVEREFEKHVHIFGPPMPVSLITTGRFMTSVCVADPTDFRGCEVVVGYEHYTSHLKVHVLAGAPPIDPTLLEKMVNEALQQTDQRLTLMDRDPVLSP